MAKNSSGLMAGLSKKGHYVLRSWMQLHGKWQILGKGHRQANPWGCETGSMKFLGATLLKPHEEKGDRQMALSSLG